MKKVISVLTSLLLVAVLLIGVTNCKKDNPTFALSTLVSGNIDLNLATPANTVPSSPTIVATFTVDVDATTVSNTSITLVRDYDAATISLTITTAGKTITIVPNEGLGDGSLYKLSFLTGIKATDGQLFAATIERTFTTAGNFVPSGVIAYWNFENNADDQVGTFNPLASDVIDITYTASRNANAGTAATFNGSTSIIEIPNGDVLMNTTDFTISFWVKTNSADKTNSHFVMGLAGWNGFQYQIFGAYDGSKFAIQYDLGDGTSASEDMWFPALADISWQGWTYAKSLTIDQMVALLKDNWLQVTYTYGAKVGTLYFDGEKMKSFDFNLWPDGDVKRGVVGLKYAGLPLGNNLALGFIQGRNNRTITDAWADYADVANEHFKGQLDDIRIFHKVLTPTEIDLMYQSEKP